MKTKHFLTMYFMIAAILMVAQDPGLPSKLHEQTWIPAPHARPLLKTQKILLYDWHKNSQNWAGTDTININFDNFGSITFYERINTDFHVKGTSTYNTDKKITYGITYSVTPAGSWSYESRQHYAYSTQGDLVDFKNETWNGASWVLKDGQKSTLMYNASGKVINNEFIMYNPAILDYEKIRRQSGYSFTTSGELVQLEFSDGNGSNWDNNEKISISWFGGQPCNWTILKWDGTAYQLSERFINVTWQSWCNVYTNTGLSAVNLTFLTGASCSENKIAGYTRQVYNSQTYSWENTERITKTYDNNGGYFELQEAFTYGAWRNYFRKIRVYDMHSNISLYTDELWLNNAWVKVADLQYINSYDSNGELTEIITQKRPSAGSWENFQKALYVDKEVMTDIETQPDKKITADLFPNPPSGSLKISIKGMNEEKLKNVKLSIFDLQGNLALSFPLYSSETEINTDRLSAGIYFYTISNEGQLYSRNKLVVE